MLLFLGQTVTVFCDDGDLLNSWQKLFLQEQKEHANMQPRLVDAGETFITDFIMRIKQQLIIYSH